MGLTPENRLYTESYDTLNSIMADALQRLDIRVGERRH